jgi:hypothetical protein
MRLVKDLNSADISQKNENTKSLGRGDVPKFYDNSHSHSKAVSVGD